MKPVNCDLGQDGEGGEEKGRDNMDLKEEQQQ